MSVETVKHRFYGQKEELKLSNHNYSQYSNKNRNSNKPNNNPANKSKKENVATFGNITAATDVKLTETATDIITPEVKMVTETVETVTLPTTAEGIVVDCARLNVREEPNVNSQVVYILDSMSEIEVNLNESNNEWVRVCTATGVEGYCMRKYVEVRL